MTKKITIVLLFALAVFECYLLYENCMLNKEVKFKDLILEKTVTERNLMKVQYTIGLENIGLNLDCDAEILDAFGNKTTLGTYFGKTKGKNMLVCRYSDKHCRQCVEHAIGNVLKSMDSMDSLDVVFVSDNASQRVANLQRKEFGISQYNCINCNSLGISAEDMAFPYYLAIDNKLKVNGIYVPDKSIAHLPLDSVNLGLLYMKQVVKQ